MDKLIEIIIPTITQIGLVAGVIALVAITGLLVKLTIQELK